MVTAATPTLSSRIAGFDARHRIVWDVALPLLLAGPVLAGHRGYHGGLDVDLVLLAPLVLRRRSPVAVFAAIAVVAFAQLLAGTPARGDVALLVALYGIAVSQPTRTTWIAGGVLEVGVVLAVLAWGREDQLEQFVALSGMVLAAGMLGANVRQRRELLTSLEDRATRLERERDQQGQLSAAAERARIAREMHDIVAHNLTVMVALADGAGWAVKDDPQRAQLAIERVSRTGREALSEMRRLLGVLREEAGARGRAPQPGLAEIDQVVEQVRAAGVPVSYAIGGAPAQPLSPGLQLAVHRIVQEALTNTLKHAGAGAHAAVALSYGERDLELTITDTGMPSSRPVEEGGGLRSMRERAAVYDGTVEAGPRGDRGWVVHARMRLAAPSVTEAAA